MATVVFDLGGVVVLWDPVPAIAAVVGLNCDEHFVHGSEFDFAVWNHAQDSSRSWRSMVPRSAMPSLCRSASSRTRSGSGWESLSAQRRAGGRCSAADRTNRLTA